MKASPIRKSPTLIHFLLVCFSLVISIRAHAAVSKIYYFYASSCEHCQRVADELLIPLAAKHPEITIRYLETGNSANYRFLLAAETQLAPDAPRQIPVILAGNRIVSGEEAIRNSIDEIVELSVTHMIEPLPGQLAAISETEATDRPFFGKIEPEQNCDEEACSRDTIWMAYFYQTGCRNCSRSEADIAYIKSKYPKLEVREFNVYANVPLTHYFADRARLKDSFETPAIFIGDDYLIGAQQINPASLETLVRKHEKGAPNFWAKAAENPDSSRVIGIFNKLGAFTVAMAGLIDGLNPCAFATILFFVSYLTISGRKGKVILAVGSAFTAGVFLAYLAVGLGFYRVLDFAGTLLTGIGRWVYGLTAVVCAIFALLSFLDYRKARKGRLDEMSLSLPEFLRSKINATIRKGRKARRFIIQSFAAGLIVSFLELACTGQIYLPTIIYVQSIPELKVRATLYLLIYNAAFVIPLVVVFFLSWYGTSSQRMTQFFKKHAASVKLAMAGLFLSLSIWLCFSVLL